jgi:5-methyltetrahydrofolate--homocysteine methyltransferase
MPPVSTYLEAIRDRVVFYGGSMGATILNMQLTAEQYGGKEGCNDYLTLVQPSIVEELHSQFLEVGADVLETNTFGGSLIKLDEYGLGDLTYELNRKAAELARGVADRYTTADKPRFVAGSVGPVCCPRPRTRCWETTPSTKSRRSSSTRFAGWSMAAATS